MSHPRCVAESAAFRSFANCYMREIDPGDPVRDRGQGDFVGWTLAEQGMALCAEVTARSLCGPFRFGALWSRALPDGEWRPIAPFHALQLMLRECHAGAGSSPSVHRAEIELLQRLILSCEAIGATLARDLPQPECGFLATEQCLVFGHWLHPTPKSLQGMSRWQRAIYAPEECRPFRLEWFAVDERHVRHGSAVERSAIEILAPLHAALTPRLAPGEVALPLHPLQAEAVKLDPRIAAMIEDGALRPLGPAGPRLFATSSVRTLYAPDLDWMLKFSLPVKITNSLRINRLAEFEAAVALAELSRGLRLAEALPGFTLIQDPAFVTLASPTGGESGFETIIRANPFVGTAARDVANLAALTADPLPGRISLLATLVVRVARRQGLSQGEAARTWFEHYLRVMIAPVVRLYDRFGIALEAHQQNSLMRCADALPRHGFYRDSEGFYLSASRRDLLAAAWPGVARSPDLFFDDATIRDRLAYYLLVNQAFSVIHRLAADGHVDETVLIARLRGHLESLAAEAGALGRAFVEQCLTDPTIVAKANLGVSLADIDELATSGAPGVFARWNNPLALVAGDAASRERPHVLAS